MKKNLGITILAIFLSLCFAGSGLAIELGNKRKGKYTYRKVYKACQQRGEVETSKPPINPDAHTQSEWKELFTNKKFDEFGCSEDWAQLSDEDLTDIFTYLYSHASDSPTPAKCK
jgi:hypothetical protein